MTWVSLRDCDNCGRAEERLFTDSWTGEELCIECLRPVLGRLALSPAEDGDNLAELLAEES